MRADGIGCQSLFRGVLNPDHKLERVPIGVDHFGVRAAVEPVLKPNVTNVFDQHRGIRTGSGENRRYG